MKHLFLLCMLPMAAQAASLRPDTRLLAPVVRMSDLFVDAGPQADRVLGPAPAPGGHIVVEARQLGAIAHQFHVAWQPLGGERIVLERAGVQLSRARVLAALGTALRGAGAPEEADLELPNTSLPIVAEGADVTLSIEALDYQPNGSFGATVLATAPGEAPVSARLAGRVVAMRTVAVPTRRIGAGEPIGPDDLILKRLHLGIVTDPVAVIADAVGLAPRHALAAGQPVPRAELAAATLVHKGETVHLALVVPGLSLGAVGVALGDASSGEHVRVRNLATSAVIEATVVGRGEARIAPDSRPVLPAAAQATVTN